MDAVVYSRLGLSSPLAGQRRHALLRAELETLQPPGLPWACVGSLAPGAPRGRGRGLPGAPAGGHRGTGE